MLLIFLLLLGCKKSEDITETKVINESELKSIEQKSTNEENVPIEGKWEWTYNPNNEDVPDMLFTLSIQKSNGNEFIAQYCAIAEKGNRIDCSNEKEYNVKGIIKGNKIEATFYSFFDNKKTKANVELLILNKDSIQWQIIKQVDFEFYAPTKCIIIKEKKKAQNSPVCELPFDLEEKDKLANLDKRKYLEVYPQLNGEKLSQVKKIISENTEDNPDEIYQINNKDLGFDSFVYCTYGDSDSQSLINIKNNKILANEFLGYAMPENKTYRSFVINKDLTINIYDVDYNSKSKKILERYQIMSDGSIIKLK